MKSHTIACLVSMHCLLLMPIAAWAQGAGSGTIAGVVKDTSGAVMPGVTVEATSPALIEKIRLVITDDQGQYKIVDLRPGVYTVTFSLPGFSVVRREGIEMTTGFTATVNAELKVGNLEETITVSGAAPIVDTQNVVQQQTFARTTLDSLPTTKRVGSYATMIPSAVATAQDVGGLIGERGAQFSVHGQRAADININQDGMNLTMFNSSGFSHNPLNVQEIVLELSGSSAETFSGGVRMSIVPKDGGNIFSGAFNTIYSHPDLQSSNLTDALRTRGLLATPSLKRTYDVGGSLGGPLKRDKLWFFAAYRNWLASRYIPGNFHNLTQSTLFYTPDLSRPAFTKDFYEDRSLRLTWQASAKDKVAVSYSVQDDCNCPIDNLGSGTTIVAPEAAGNHFYQPNWIGTASWSRPATSRLLFEGGVSASITVINAKRHPDVGPNNIAVTELSTNIRYGNRANNLGNTCCYSTTNAGEQFTQRLAVSYITGSHAYKAGFSIGEYRQRHRMRDAVFSIPGARFYSFRNQQPVSVTLYATPFGVAYNTTTFGAYMQDQWTIRKLTLNLGVRYDAFNGSVPAQHFEAGLFVPARDLPVATDSPDWKNLNPRLGVAYDIFGNGRTAIKMSLGRYVSGTSGNSNAALNNPISNQANSATRTWDDSNRNVVPDCVLGASVPGANGECGALSDQAFGQVRAGNTRYADDALSGFNDSQAYNWQGSASVQHELRAGMALNVGYFRTWYGNFLVTDNLAVTPADHDSYCIAAPVDSRLPGGGQQMCGLYDLTPTLFGLVDNLVSQATNYGKRTEVYNGIDMTLSARFRQGGQFSGGVSMGRTTADNCAVVDSPQQARPGFCSVRPPWSAGTQVRFLVVYPLPWDLQTSATYQNIPGIPITASYVATNAQIAPSLHRNLGACRGAATCNSTATIDLIPPSTVFEDRLQQVDLRFSRTFHVNKMKIRGNVDLYNAFNANSILSINTRFGPNWLNAQEILPGRLLKFGVQVDF